jgi:hypothetical protein
MNATEIVTTAVSTLVVLVLAHVAVYWVVKTLYPPTPVVAVREPEPIPAPASAPAPTPTVTFAEPPPSVQQNVTLPTYETTVPAEAPREGGERRGPPPAERTSIRRDTGVAAPDAQ